MDEGQPKAKQMLQTENPNNMPKQSAEVNNQRQLNVDVQFRQYKYRWIIAAIMSYALLMNGLANNVIVPIAKKLTVVYELSTGYIDSPVVLSFLIYTIFNFPANFIIDKKGLRFSFLVGSFLFLAGLSTVCFINKSFIFVLIGVILIAIGQPFLINCPAKVAAFWFSNQNRTFATAIMTVFLFFGAGLGFFLPTIFVKEDSVGQQAKNQIFKLYATQTVIAAVLFLIVLFLMRAAPPTPPSKGAKQQKLPFIKALKLLKSNKNMWIFLGGFIMVYGNLIVFGAQANILFKPYGFQDMQIALLIVCLLTFGVAGSLAVSLYVKKTLKFKLCIRLLPTIAFCAMILTDVLVNLTENIVIMMVVTAVLGFFFTPLVPICYDLGCQLAFPVGQAQVIGILNGGAMFYTFLMTLIFNTTIFKASQGTDFDEKTASLIVLAILSALLSIGVICFWFVKVILKRRMLQSGQINEEQIQNEQKIDQNKQQGDLSKQIQMTQTMRKDILDNQAKQGKKQLLQNSNYINLVQEGIQL